MRYFGQDASSLFFALPGCWQIGVTSETSAPQVSAHVGTRALHPLRKVLEDRSLDDRHFLLLQDRARSTEVPLKSYATASLDPLVAQVPNRPLLSDSSIFSPYPNESDDIVRGFSSELLSNEADSACCVGSEGDVLHPSANGFAGEITSRGFPAEQLSSVSDQTTVPSSSADALPEVNYAADQSASTIVDSTSSGSPMTFDAADGAFSDASIPTTFPVDGTEIENSISRFVDSVGKSIFQAEDALTETYDKLRISAYDAIGNWKRSVDSAVNGLSSSVDITKKQTTGEMTGFSSALQAKVNGAGALAVDILRRAVLTAEDSLSSAATFVVYSYGSAKSSLPPNIRDVLNSSEEKAAQVLSPIGNALQQVYVIIEGVEKNLGLDPSDPIVQLVVLLGSSATIGISYWLFTYGGYSGDLAPELTFELLKNDEKVVLIDVRPEDIRERDGIPDLRRGARSKYASVISPEINGSVKKMLKGGRDVDDALLAVVIRNLKMIKGDSKVIIMDVNGTRSKAIARSLKRLGVKRPYLVKGGFQAWAKSLRVKELKPETALTVLNEDAEAILADIKPTPTLVLGSALGLSAATYALLEWETTLQFIGVLGLGLTLYLRFSSYEGSEDLKQDISLLLSPVRMGTEAFSWAAKKLEPNKIGLPTSPSTTAVQARVLQAAAKHESQPSDAEEPSGQTDNLVSEA